MSERDDHRLYLLFLRLLDRQLLAEEEEALQRLFRTHPEVLQQYVQFIYMQEAMHGQFTSALQNNDLTNTPEKEVGLLEMIQRDALTQVEPDGTCTSCGIPSDDETDIPFAIQTTSEEQERIQEIEKRANRQLAEYLEEQRQQRLTWECSPRESFDLHGTIEEWRRRMQQAYRVARRVAIGVAALLLCIISVWGTVHYFLTHRIVAELGKTVNAQWSQAPDVPDLSPGLRYLEQGVAQIRFKSGAQVLLQAPCEFNLKSPNRMEMYAGSLSAQVPPRAYGFTIETPNGKVVDYGTEFGIAVDQLAQAEVHVFDGSVGFKSSKARNQTQAILEQGDAIQINREGNARRCELLNRPRFFLRELPATNSWGIPGVRIDLADIVGGGNGFGTGLRYDPNTGQGSINPLTGRVHDTWRPGAEMYNPIYLHITPATRFMPSTDLPYIDGVLIPDGGQSVCVVSTEGHVFAECPDTDGKIKWNINNGWQYANREIGLHNTQALIDSPGISMHANCGLTFALESMRQAMSDIEIVQFATRAGMPVNSDPEHGEIDIWVLVDGRIRYEQTDIRVGQLFDIEVRIQPEDRFLSLVVTDSQTEGVPHWSRNSWCHFFRPCLSLNRREAIQ